ncbi:hypothetical protein DKX38_014994 [Salix brachista]|uniref:Uncharacterized protein n=1 Tax=Salix brachista TaxID=2182728 RepID=A0A5N5L5U2_9ROSI|nr:hypothetical protein DKX38_014994 [Salix brachista]
MLEAARSLYIRALQRRQNTTKLIKMKLEIEVISREVIKPSSPTPDHLRHYQLSFLDQISPPVYNPLLLFYPADGDVKINSTEKTNQLKQSLSEVLSLYYPLAGRIQDNLFVECNDEGIPFFQAEVRCRLSQVAENPAPGELSKLIPFALDDAEGLPLGIQYNIFECGGIVIGGDGGDRGAEKYGEVDWELVMTGEGVIMGSEGGDDSGAGIEREGGTDGEKLG